MSADTTRPRRVRWLIVTMVVALSFGAAAALMITADGGEAPIVGVRPPAPVAVDTAPPVAVPYISAEQLQKLPAATTDTTIAASLPDDHPAGSTAGAVVHNRQQVPVFDAPGGTAFARLPPHQLGADTWLPVIAQRNGWMRVLLPNRPNGSTGWLSTGQLTIARSTTVIHIAVDDARLSVITDGRPAGSWTVSTGTNHTPTPQGRTFLLAQIRDPRQPFSPLIITLGTHSAALDRYAGGPGTVGIHTWPTTTGPRSSHGCIRVPVAALDALRAVPLGTVVYIDHLDPKTRKESR